MAQISVNLEFPFAKDSLIADIDFENRIRSATDLFKISTNLKQKAKALSDLCLSINKATLCDTNEARLISQIINLSQYCITFSHPFHKKIVIIPIKYQNAQSYFTGTLLDASEQLQEIANRISESATRIMEEEITFMRETAKTKQLA